MGRLPRSHIQMRGVRVRRRSVALACCAAAMTAAPATAGAQAPTSSEQLRRGVTRAGLVEHQRNLQAIANLNNGTRATGTPGYEASVAYVIARLERAGYNVRTEPFDYPTWQENAPPTLQAAGQTWTPGAAADDDTPDVDFITFEFSASGDTGTVPVVPVTNNVEPPAPTP